MESQPQNPEFRINPENFHPWGQEAYILAVAIMYPLLWVQAVKGLGSLCCWHM